MYMCQNVLHASQSSQLPKSHLETLKRSNDTHMFYIQIRKYVHTICMPKQVFQEMLCFTIRWAVWPDWVNIREFSPNGWSLTLDSCVKITEVAQIFGQLFAAV
jgi:hypothetical protein